MTVTVRSFAKINLGLYIGPPRTDGFHALRTLYQTIALHDVIRVSVRRGNGIEILCADPRVPRDESNTCFRIAERAMKELGTAGKVVIEIEKRLPVQGGMGAASSNAVATLIALQRALKKALPGPKQLQMAAEVGSDLPQFLIGGTSLGVGRGEEVYPVPDLPGIPMVVVTAEIGVSTPRAFADWDAMTEKITDLRVGGRTQPALRERSESKGVHARKATALTTPDGSDRLSVVGHTLSAWLSGLPHTGALAGSRSRAGSLLLDLVRTGIENDFEKVVFPQYPELRDIKRALERTGAGYASLSGSGSTVYGLFETRVDARTAAARLRNEGLKAVATNTLTRAQYWKKIVDC